MSPKNSYTICRLDAIDAKEIGKDDIDRTDWILEDVTAALGIVRLGAGARSLGLPPTTQFIIKSGTNN